MNTIRNCLLTMIVSGALGAAPAWAQATGGSGGSSGAGGTGATGRPGATAPNQSDTAPYGQSNMNEQPGASGDTNRNPNAQGNCSYGSAMGQNMGNSPAPCQP